MPASPGDKLCGGDAVMSARASTGGFAAGRPGTGRSAPAAVVHVLGTDSPDSGIACPRPAATGTAPGDETPASIEGMAPTAAISLSIIEPAAPGRSMANTPSPSMITAPNRSSPICAGISPRWMRPLVGSPPAGGVAATGAAGPTALTAAGAEVPCSADDSLVNVCWTVVAVEVATALPACAVSSTAPAGSVTCGGGVNGGSAVAPAAAPA